MDPWDDQHKVSVTAESAIRRSGTDGAGYQLGVNKYNRGRHKIERDKNMKH